MSGLDARDGSRAAWTRRRFNWADQLRPPDASPRVRRSLASRRAPASRAGRKARLVRPSPATSYLRRPTPTWSRPCMPVESVFAKLEPLLPTVQKPIQYVGGELNSTTKDWDSVDGPLGADVPRRVRGRPAQPGRADPLRDPQRARLDPGRAHVRRVRRHGAGDARQRASRSSPSTGTARSARSTCSGCRSRPSSATPTCSPRSTSPASRCTPSTATTRTRSCSPAGTRRSTPSRSPTSSTPPCSATARRSCSRSATSSASGRTQGSPGGRDEVLMRLAASGGVYVPKFYDVDYLPDGRIKRVAPNRSGVPWRVHKHTLMDLDQWPYPSKPARAAGRDGARALLGRDLPRLHPRLPLLPGRHDHPAGARALDHHDRRHGRERHQAVRLRGGRPAVAVVGRPQRDRRGGQGTGRPLRGHATSRCRCRPPGSTRSTSRWPTSSRATAAGPV